MTPRHWPSLIVAIAISVIIISVNSRSNNVGIRVNIF